MHKLFVTISYWFRLVGSCSKILVFFQISGLLSDAGFNFLCHAVLLAPYHAFAITGPLENYPASIAVVRDWIK